VRILKKVVVKCLIKIISHLSCKETEKATKALVETNGSPTDIRKQEGTGWEVISSFIYS
jgi:hypothetical protein